MDRRSFIKLTAITGTSTALASCRNPDHSFIRFLPEDELTPGIAVWKPSVCPLCASGCGLTVRVMDTDVEVVRDNQAGVTRMGIAKKLEGNPKHPVSQGRICARGQSAIQVTFHPDRITQPLKRSGDRGTAKFDAIGWDEAIAELASKLDAVAGNPQALAYIRSRRTGQRAAVVEQFVAGLGAGAPITFDVLSDDVLRRANLVSFGHEQLPTFDFARSRYVLSFGADFLGTWNSPVAHAAAYGEMRQGRPGIRGAFVQVESRMTQTGANADQWIPAKPGTEGVLALGIAHVLMEHKLASGDAGRAGAAIAGWAGGLANYSPENVREITGVPAARIERLARDFASHGPAVAVVGGPPLAHTNGFFTALAVNALNALAGTVGKPGGLFFTPRSGKAAAPAAPGPTVDKLAAAINGGQQVQVLLLDGANPIYGAPAAWKVKDAFAKVPFIASFGSFVDDSTAHADLILPDHSFLESWVDAAPESGSLVPVLSVAGPAMKPLHKTRATADVLLEIGAKLQKPIALPKTYDEAIKTAFEASPAGADAWTGALTDGGWWGEAPKEAAAGAVAKTAAPAAFAAPTFDGDAGTYPYHFLPYASSAFLDGSLAHLPWLQEMPDPLTSAMWSSWIEINPATAEKLGIHELDIVEVTSSHGTLRTAAVVTPGIAPDMVAMPIGQGHETFTRFASGRGENPLSILAPVTEPETGSLAWAATRVKITRVGENDGRLILYAGSKYEKPNHGRR